MNSEEDITKINDKMDAVLEALQGFGLNIITQIGGLKHNISVLTNQVDKLNDSMLNLKSIGVKLENLGKMKESFNSELKQIQTLIRQSNLIRNMDIKSEEIDEKKDLLRVIEKLTRSLKPEISIDGKQVYVTASMGASIYPNHGTKLEQLMQAADIALYQAKNTHSGWKVFIDEQYSWLKE